MLCLWFAGRACQLRDATGEPEWLCRAATAAALADTEPDYGDWYLTLSEVWTVAVRQGLDPRRVFAAASAVAAERRDAGGGSTRKMLGEFEKSAYFAESVAPKLRDSNTLGLRLIHRPDSTNSSGHWFKLILHVENAGCRSMFG